MCMGVHVHVCVSVYIVNCEYFIVKIFSDSLAYMRKNILYAVLVLAIMQYRVICLKTVTCYEKRDRLWTIIEFNFYAQIAFSEQNYVAGSE